MIPSYMYLSLASMSLYLPHGSGVDSDGALGAKGTPTLPIPSYLDFTLQYAEDYNELWS